MEAEKMTFGVIIAARMGSKRLPGKALLPLMGIPVISFIIRRLKKSKLASNIIFATTLLKEDDELASVAQNEGVEVFRGSENDVLSRYVQAASAYNFNYVVRITGDCPFVDAHTLDYVLNQCKSLRSFDLATTKPAYPHGIDYEIYPKVVLEKINELPLTAEEREHHLNFFYKNENQFTIQHLQPPPDLKLEDTIFLLDTAIDYANINAILRDINNIFVSPSELIKKHINAN